MKARYLTLAALAALVTACGGGSDQEPKAGDSANPGATGTIESTSQEVAAPSTPVDTLTASDATTAGANGSAAPAPGTPGAATTMPSAPADSAHAGH